MRALRALAVTAVTALGPASVALAQSTADHPWAYSISGTAYILPGDDDYFQPTFTADHDWLHLEARHNYEAFETGSAWAGYNFSVGETVTFEGSAMLGVVFGATDGIAPGYKASVGWTRLALYSEGEYVFDTNDSAGSFFYSWTQLTWELSDWASLGLVGQRTKVYETDRDIQRGFIVGFSSEHVEFTASIFNPDERRPTFVIGLGVSF